MKLRIKKIEELDSVYYIPQQRMFGYWHSMYMQGSTSEEYAKSILDKLRYGERISYQDEYSE